MEINWEVSPVLRYSFFLLLFHRFLSSLFSPLSIESLQAFFCRHVTVRQNRIVFFCRVPAILVSILTWDFPFAGLSLSLTTMVTAFTFDSLLRTVTHFSIIVNNTVLKGYNAPCIMLKLIACPWRSCRFCRRTSARRTKREILFDKEIDNFVFGCNFQQK